MNNIKGLKIGFLCFAIVGFMLAVSPLFPWFFPSITDISTRADLSSALATSIAIILAIIATFLLVKVESTEFKAIERVKADTIQLAGCLKTLYQLQYFNDYSSETTKPYEQQISTFLSSTSAFAFDCWITQEDKEEWKDFSIDLLFISTGCDEKDPKPYHLKTFGLIQLLESLLEKDILSIVKNLSDTNTAMETFKKSNARTPLHSATKIMFRAYKQQKYGLENLLTPIKSVLEKSINLHPEQPQGNAKRLLLAFYNDDKVWIGNNLNTETKLTNSSELKETITKISFGEVEDDILNSLADELYINLIDSEKAHINYSGFFEKFERIVSQEKYYQILHDYFKSYFNENSHLDLGDNARLNRMKGLLFDLYIDGFNYFIELNTDTVTSEMHLTLAEFFPDDFKTNEVSIESIKKKYLETLSHDYRKDVSNDFKELLESLNLHGLIHKPSIKILEIINASPFKGAFSNLAFIETLKTKEYLSVDEEISTLKHLYTISGHAQFVSLETFIYRSYKNSIEYKDEYDISDEVASAKKLSDLLKFSLKTVN